MADQESIYVSIFFPMLLTTTWGKNFAYDSDVTEMLLLLWVVQGHVPRALHTILRGSLYVCVA